MNALPYTEVRGTARALDALVPLKVEEARPHSLLVRFEEREHLPAPGARFEQLTLLCAGKVATLGPCSYEAASRSESDLDPPDGRLVFLEQVYDFSQLFQSGRISELGQKVRQLPLVWGRKSSIQPAFKDFTSQLLYELQVYRSLFDGLDRSLAFEPPEVRDEVRRVATASEYPNFAAFVDRQLTQLEASVRRFTKLEHERHGFYFRKQLSDVIRSSRFLNRTNLKPRGFAGDSQLMKLVYAHEFDGEGLFSKFMHRHPLDSAACVAMRNTRTVVARATRRALERSPRARVLSVGCGPALELFDAVVTPEDAARLAFTLLDQDPLALVDAQHTVRAVEARVGRSLDVGYVRDSVRMMSRSDRLEARFGRFELVSAMGLFDALTPPVARQVLTRLYEVLEPGGELVLSNFHGRQSSRIYMEYWMDWVLYAREEEELLELAAHLPGAETSLSYEDTGSQLFLTVRKP
jgi:extracellular factor (EF) 3-hydroxypalmitic acid methyl ester biosynthesis protein